MKLLIAAISFLVLVIVFSCKGKIKNKGAAMTRGEVAYDECYGELAKKLEKNGVAISSLELLIRVFKQEEILEVWAKNKLAEKFKKIAEYPFCKNSGTLGPKRKEGDQQIPEGFYHIDRFNGKSKFYLSLGINYPNAADLVLADKQKPGSDIFIHGGCATVGCIPITNEKIKALWVLASEALTQGQSKIPVHIFPFEMTAENLRKNSQVYPQHRLFWESLQKGFLYFEEYRSVPQMTALSNGYYHLSK
ncbi:MAG: L,D-transpeptidase family protein [Bacteroidota bacterium]